MDRSPAPVAAVRDVPHLVRAGAGLGRHKPKGIADPGEGAPLPLEDLRGPRELGRPAVPVGLDSFKKFLDAALVRLAPPVHLLEPLLVRDPAWALGRPAHARLVVAACLPVRAAHLDSPHNGVVEVALVQGSHANRVHFP